MDLRAVQPFDEMLCAQAFEHEGVNVPEGAIGWVIETDPIAETVDLIFCELWPSAALMAVPASRLRHWSGRSNESELVDFLNGTYRALEESEAELEAEHASYLQDPEVGKTLDGMKS
jgi:hypothetical protein